MGVNPQGLRRSWRKEVGPKPTEMCGIIDGEGGRRSMAQIKNEPFRILKGMPSGDAQAAVDQGIAGVVCDVFRRPVPKAKSRTKVAVRKSRQNTNSPRKVNDISDYDAAGAG